MTLTLEDEHHLQAASGYIELGMHLDANDELEQVRTLPQVLVVRRRILIFRCCCDCSKNE